MCFSDIDEISRRLSERRAHFTDPDRGISASSAETPEFKLYLGRLAAVFGLTPLDWQETLKPELDTLAQQLIELLRNTRSNAVRCE